MSSASFVDPRSQPRPCPSTRLSRTTPDPENLADLHQLCRQHRLYEVEEWIRAGRPLQLAAEVSVKGRHWTSALEIGLQAQNQALVLLLLCNGYDLELERACPLDLALRVRRWDLVELLLEWGADPHRVCLADLFDTYRLELFDRFTHIGVDLTAGHELATALAHHPGNKPLFGFAKRHRMTNPKIQTELDMALAYHAGRDGNEKGVQLCLWAGADPHAQAPSLRYLDLADEEDAGTCAVEEACRAGHSRILAKLRPDPSRADFDVLYACAPNAAVVELLARIATPKRVGHVIRLQAYWMQNRIFGGGRSADVLRAFFRAGIRWREATEEEITETRRALLRMRDETFVDVLKLLADGDHCAPSILHSLARSSSMRKRLRAVGFLPSVSNDARGQHGMRPTRAREVLAKCGVPGPKTKRRLPSVVEIGWRRGPGRELRIPRVALFERIWSEPVEQLAEAWGLSGRGLAKACERARIPVPPRGFWAKVQHGKAVRRPQLPALQPGEIEEIVIHLPPS